MKNLPYDRSERVADLIYQIVSEAICTELADPRLKEIWITRVRVTKDLRVAHVNFHLRNCTEEGRGRALKGLASASGFFKRKIGEAVDLKFMPELKYYYDDTVDAKERVDELLEVIKKEGVNG